MLPEHVIMVRHGQSGGNAVMDAVKHGGAVEEYYTDEFVNTPSRKWPLTPKGVAQAQTAGKFVQSVLEEPWCSHSAGRRFHVSPLLRTRQTAGHLGLVDGDYTNRPSVQWRLNRSIRERDWGDVETVPKSVWRNDPAYAHNELQERINPLYWRPRGGEAVVDVAENRVLNWLDTLHREVTGVEVAVTHGEFIRATHLTLTRADDEEYDEWEGSLRVANCEIFHYTRIVPEARFCKGMFETWPKDESTTRPSRRHLAYLRRARPVQAEDGTWTMEVDEWQEINFHQWDNEELITTP